MEILLDAEKSSDKKLVRLRSFPGRLYAEMIREALEKENIPSIIKGEDTGILGAGSMTESSPGKVTVWVRQSDRQRADSIVIQMLDHI